MQRLPSKPPKPHLLALACLGLLSSGLRAQTPTEPQNLERVEVTGSHIKRATDEGSSPVQVLRREELQRLGANTVQQLLSAISSNSGGLSDLDGANSFAAGSSGTSQRNLGKQSTLVLLNFRRVAPYPLADFSEVFTNLDALPAEAVERIEILKAGGAAIYGSDAVAGVINIITRQDYQGLQVSASHQQALGIGKFPEDRASLTAGHGDLGKNGYNLFAHLEVFKRGEQGSWRELMPDVNPDYKTAFPGLGGPDTYSDFSPTGNLFPAGAPPKALPGCAAPLVNGLCLHDTLAEAKVSPASQRSNLLLRARYRPSDKLEGFTELLWSRTSNSYGASAFSNQWPYQWLNPRTGQPLSFVPRRGLPAGHPLNPSPMDAEFHYRFGDAQPSNELRSSQYRLVTGLLGSWDALDWELAAGVTGGRTKLNVRGQFASDSGFKELVGDYRAFPLPPDFFNKPNGYKLGGNNSPEVISRLFPDLGWDGDNRQLFVDGKVSGEIAQWSTGAVGLAAGFDFRQDRMTILPTQNIRDGDIIGLGSSQSDGKRNIAALYSELSLPLTRQLTAELAARVDKYDGFGAHGSPKLALRYQASPQWLLRGALETGFRAPNLTESATSTKSSFTGPTQDPRRCDASQALAADLRAQADALPPGHPMRGALLGRAGYVGFIECGGFMNLVSLNNPALKPETSRSLSLGTVIEPAKGWNIGLDYYNIQRKDEISLRDPVSLLATEGAQPAGVIQREADPNRDRTFITPAERAKYFNATRPYAGGVLLITNRFENQFKTRTSGLDFSLNASQPTAWGKLGWTVDASYLLNFQQWLASKDDWSVNMAGRYSFPRLKMRNTLSLQRGDFNHALSLSYAGSTSLQGNDDDPRYGAEDCRNRAWTEAQCQVAASYRVDYFLAYAGIKNLKLTLNVQNLLNRRPPTDFRAADQARGGAYPFDRQDVTGRTLRLGAEYRFF